MNIVLNNLSFGYTLALIEDLNCRFDRGWSAIVGTNGSGKTTLLKLITGELTPDSGTVTMKGGFIYCSQLTDDIPDAARMLFQDNSSHAYQLRIKFGLDEHWSGNWEKLSFGERKRIQIASAFYLEPDILIVDEPTNHLDAPGRELLSSALQSFRGTGIVVSHDRMLLDVLPYQTLFLDSQSWDLRPHAYTKARKAREAEAEYDISQRRNLSAKVKQLKNQASHYRRLAGNADRARSKKNISRKDHDAKAKIDAARITGKDAVHGKLLNQMQGRISQEEDKLQNLHVQRRQSFNFSLHFKPGRRKTLFMVEEDMLRMGEKTLNFNSFQLKSEDKVSLTGLNGSGKSTLLRHIYSRCRKDSTLYIPQELENDSVERFFASLNRLDSMERGEIYSIMAALGSSPERVLYAEKPSPGEIRKLLIADAIRKQIELLILDEPTNHLDLHSIEALETALTEYRAGLVLVSHDRYFLDKTASVNWQITGDKGAYKLDI